MNHQKQRVDLSEVYNNTKTPAEVLEMVSNWGVNTILTQPQKCEGCGGRATQVTLGQGHAMAVFYMRRPHLHCNNCKWPSNYFYPRSFDLPVFSDEVQT